MSSIDQLNIIVLLKQVPDIEKVKFDFKTGRIDRSSAEAVINPFDLNALEAAVEIKEEVGARITVISMGPKTAEASLRDAIARGADEAILLTDKRFAGADTLATSYTLACAIRKVGSYDLVICGEKTIDGDTAQVGPEVAEFLGVPHVAYVEEIREVKRDRILVKSKMGRNYYIIELRFPGLITVTKDVNTPRLPSLKDKIRSRKAEITVWNADSLSDMADERYFGAAGSPTNVAKVYVPKAERRKGKIFRGDLERAAKEIAAVLREAHVIRGESA